MKEQDAAHSFEKGSETPLGFNVENVKDRANANIIHKLNEELTRLRSELQQEINLREAQQDVMAVDTVKLLDQIEFQNKTSKEDHDKIKKLEFELQQERELRKELVNCLEVHQTKWISADHYWGSDTNEWAETLIEKAKLRQRRPLKRLSMKW